MTETAFRRGSPLDHSYDDFFRWVPRGERLLTTDEEEQSLALLVDVTPSLRDSFRDNHGPGARPRSPAEGLYAVVIDGEAETHAFAYGGRLFSAIQDFREHVSDAEFVTVRPDAPLAARALAGDQ
jgi:hypothetical protein